MNDKKHAAAVVALGVTLFASFAVSGPAAAQRPGSLYVDVGECVQLESPGERLDCYERQVKRAQAQPAAAAAAPAAPPSVAAPAPAPAAPAAGNAPAERSVRVEEARVANGAAAASPTLTGTIVALREIVPNRWLITLNNGDAWRQTFAEPYRLQIGQRVEIAQRRRFGTSYQLTAVGVNGNIQVELVR